MPAADRETRTVAPVLVGAALSAAVVAGLFFYKWTGALKVVLAARAAGVLKKSPDVLFSAGALHATIAYFAIIWPALVFGIVIGSLAQAALPARWIEAVLGRRGARSILAGGIVGAPMMLCSCCISPVSAGLYARGARLGPSLAVMLGSPGLNLAALFLTFLLFPTPVAVARLIGAALLVFGLSAVIAMAFDGVAIARDPRMDQEADAPNVRAFAERFARSLIRMAIITVPLVFVGVLVSSLVLPHAIALSKTGTVVTITFVAFVATLVALPTFFEIPIALLVVGLGAPLGAAVAFLIAGPIVNLPSLFVLARQTGPRVAVCVALGVWVVATLAGLTASL